MTFQNSLDYIYIPLCGYSVFIMFEIRNMLLSKYKVSYLKTHRNFQSKIILFIWYVKLSASSRENLSTSHFHQFSWGSVDFLKLNVDLS